MSDFLDDPRLSFRATGILAYLLSKPDTQLPRETLLSRAKRDGRTAVRSSLDELIAYGYLTRRAVRSSLGRVVEWRWTVTASPVGGAVQHEKGTNGRTFA